jgi:hypothetical protein
VLGRNARPLGDGEPCLIRAGLAAGDDLHDHGSTVACRRRPGPRWHVMRAASGRRADANADPLPGE